MEYAAGESLEQRILSGIKPDGTYWPPRGARHWICQVFLAMEHLLHHGLMIRDIKPDNIMLTKREGGHAKMIDFGCGCVGLERKGLTFLHIIGTPGYTAP